MNKTVAREITAIRVLIWFNILLGIIGVGFIATNGPPRAAQAAAPMFGQGCSS
jgi:hypothetical protein